MNSIGGDDVHSQATTEPYTPRASPAATSVGPDHDGDFARLIPQNRAACIAFSQLVEASKAGPETGIHGSKFMYIRANKTCYDSDLSTSDPDVSHSSRRPGDTAQTKLWSGYYRLNMDILPQNYKLGWVVGRGRADHPNGGVDLQLTNSKGLQVSGRHARFSHNAAGILLITSDVRKVVLDGKEILRNDRRAIASPLTGIQFGDLTYVLEFTNLPGYRQQLANIRKKNDEMYKPPSFLDPTPSSADFVLEVYVIQAVFAQGSTCTVSCGYVRKTGSLVAIKRMKRHTYNKMHIAREVKLLRAVTPHVSDHTA